MYATRQHTYSEAQAIVRQREAYRQLGHALKGSKRVEFHREGRRYPMRGQSAAPIVQALKDTALIASVGLVYWIAAGLAAAR